MKQPDETRREFVRQWLAKADEDLALAHHIVASNAPFLNAIGFHSQQAAEKYIKAYLVSIQVDFPKTHDIEALLKIIAGHNQTMAHSLEDAIALTDFGVEARYPANLPELSTAQAREAVKLADKVHTKIVGALKQSGYID